MISPSTCIIFDFGNVFIKWDPHAIYKRYFPTPEAVNAFLEEIRFSEWNSHQDAGRSFAEGIEELSSRYPQYAEEIRDYDIFWEDSITETNTETIQIARELRRGGYELYLLSNFSAEKFPLMRKRCDFLDLFTDIIISGELKLIKPDPAIYLSTLKRINRKAEECVFIDDSLANIKTANNLGFKTIHYKSSKQLKRELENIL